MLKQQLVAAAVPDGASAVAGSPILRLLRGDYLMRWRVEVLGGWAGACHLLSNTDWKALPDQRAACLAGMQVTEVLLRLAPLLPHQPEMEQSGDNGDSSGSDGSSSGSSGSGGSNFRPSSAADDCGSAVDDGGSAVAEAAAA